MSFVEKPVERAVAIKALKPWWDVAIDYILIGFFVVGIVCTLKALMGHEILCFPDLQGNDTYQGFISREEAIQYYSVPMSDFVRSSCHATLPLYLQYFLYTVLVEKLSMFVINTFWLNFPHIISGVIRFYTLVLETSHLRPAFDLRIREFQRLDEELQEADSPLHNNPHSTSAAEAKVRERTYEDAQITQFCETIIRYEEGFRYSRICLGYLIKSLLMATLCGGILSYSLPHYWVFPHLFHCSLPMLKDIGYSEFMCADDIGMLFFVSFVLTRIWICLIGFFALFGAVFCSKSLIRSMRKEDSADMDFLCRLFELQNRAALASFKAMINSAIKIKSYLLPTTPGHIEFSKDGKERNSITIVWGKATSAEEYDLQVRRITTGVQVKRKSVFKSREKLDAKVVHMTFQPNTADVLGLKEGEYKLTLLAKNAFGTCLEPRTATMQYFADGTRPEIRNAPLATENYHKSAMDLLVETSC
ncbi:volume-regulated anion channel subunit LRRC8E-like isoform X2 [Branchiostoma lanceolatum]|uniref:volume-regulated anion channel subunit LRRC8E-like isoform X2 n=1 Tax=Branchiostoma lanceolatum TaxID=7740 RepID=UPI003454EC1F